MLLRINAVCFRAQLLFSGQWGIQREKVCNTNAGAGGKDLEAGYNANCPQLLAGNKGWGQEITENLHDYQFLDRS